MQERTKKLKCLCRISRLIESHHNREGAILQGIVNLLPPSWQYPEICCAKLTLDDTEYRSRGYQRSPWFQSAPVRIAGRVAGLLEVFYLEKIETQEVGPFLQEEQELLDAVAERVGSVLERIAVERQLKADQAALKERLKELGCLYGISQLAERYSGSLNDLLQGIVELLPPSWQYPEICQARLVLYDQSYQTVGLRETYWVQEAPVRVRGEKAGQIEVFYLEPRPILDEGPFLREERDLIDAIAERVGKMVEQFQAEQQMQIDRSALQETNAALKGVLARIEEEKRDIRDAIRVNVEKILTPTLRALASEIPAQQRKYVTLLQNQLEELVSPFASRISQSYSSLTPAEIEICDMIRSGMTTKQIASLRHVAPATISKQRERIRRKLALSGKNANLMTHLLILASENGQPPVRPD